MKKLFQQTLSKYLPDTRAEREKPKEHYLIRRKNKLLKLLNCARKDRNDLKAIQAQRLIIDLESVLSINGKLLYAHIEQKQVIN